ncbi:NUDIX hydrolase [Nostocoides veronense]|uniref:NUDIX hydrolase n=1 Tax=Nostocoides veronense TaxID=330836 RepID=A0ABN2LYU8_9MICO
MPPSRSVPAAGTLPWRVVDGELQVLLVHRPRYDDWSWAKGKLDPGEDYAIAAARETFEETDFMVRLGRPLPDARYQILERDHTFAVKSVRYWASTITGGSGKPRNEIDKVAWMSPTQAHAALDYARDRDQLLALVAMHRAGELDTWPLIIVRHATALPRSKWSQKDWLRPLDPDGQARAEALVPVLTAYGPLRAVSSSSVRCRDTLAPYARAGKTALKLRDSLSEEVFDKNPERALKTVRKVIRRGRPTALCSHRPLLPAILGQLLEVAADADVAALLQESIELGMDKGEAIVCHLSGTGAGAKIVAAERHTP